MNEVDKNVIDLKDPISNDPKTHAPLTNVSSGDAPGNSPLHTSTLKENVIAAMRTCYDPEIPVNIYDLGLIYDTKVEPTGQVFVKMTLTAPGCPAAGTLPGEVEDKIRVLPLVKDVKVEVIWDPPWDKSKMSEAALLQLGLL
jgi:FeS assembly SUF system protein